MLACQASSPPNQASAPTQGTRLWALYMIGSDMEDDLDPRNGIPDEEDQGQLSIQGAGSADIREMIRGYLSLSAEEQKRVSVLLAFGGARKQGWQGIKYADMPCLLKDAEDNYFGNASCYSYQNPAANLANESTLTHFLQAVQTQAQTHAQTYLTLWDHGAAYLGMGLDQNHALSTLNMSTLSKALKAARLNVDLIGFDACMMANLELANLVASNGQYFVASEALEPGHGWSYTPIIQALGQAQMNPKTLGKTIVDSFMDDEAHGAGRHKTLSVLDLDKIQPAIAELDTLIQQLDMSQFAVLLHAVSKTQRFGVQLRHDLVHTMDALHLLENLETELGASSALAQAREALNTLILYNRHDGSKPEARGVALFALSRILRLRYRQTESFSEPWLTFVQAFFEHGSNDVLPPLIRFDGAVSDVGEPAAGCTENGQTGFCLNVSDDKGLHEVNQIFAVEQAGELLLLGHHGLLPIAKDRYFAPLWDGQWLSLCDGVVCSQPVYPAAHLHGRTDHQTAIYTANALFNGETVAFYFELDADNQLKDHWAVPYTLDDKGHPLHSRAHLSLKQGDTVQFFHKQLNPQTHETRWETGAELKITQEPVWQYEPVEGKPQTLVEVRDFKGHIALTDPLE